MVPAPANLRGVTETVPHEATREVPVRSLTFSGYAWDVRGDGVGGPGPNTWDETNAHVDPTGRLHLRLTRNPAPAGGTDWHCVELSTRDRLGFGRYQFQLTGRIDQLDPNVVLGLFKYPPGDVGPDGTNEIDIEFARWGHATAPHNADYVVYPAVGPRVGGDHLLFRVALHGASTTHRFDWTSTQVTFQSLHGHRDDDTDEFERWAYSPGEARLMPQQPTPVRINLWLFDGRAPLDNSEVEIIVDQFTFTPPA